MRIYFQTTCYGHIAHPTGDHPDAVPVEGPDEYGALYDAWVNCTSYSREEREVERTIVRLLASWPQMKHTRDTFRRWWAQDYRSLYATKESA